MSRYACKVLVRSISARIMLGWGVEWVGWVGGWWVEWVGGWVGGWVVGWWVAGVY